MFPRSRPQDADASIRQTDTDAAIAKLSAMNKQYLIDPFIHHFIPKAHLLPPRPPLINIGTYVRTVAIDNLVSQWMQISQKNGTKCQIVSLGCGSDTRFWNIATGPTKDNLARYIEVDYPEITTKKAMTIRKSRELSSIVGDSTIGDGGTSLHSSIYNLFASDLRLPPSENLGEKIAPILSPELPTVLLFECVLVYMSPRVSDSLLQWFIDYFSPSSTPLGCIIYEMFGLDDAFGRVMINNLMTRNITLPGAKPYETIDSLSDRFLNHGFSAACALTLRDIRREYISEDELERISKLELLDEVEELELVLNHYAISWGLWLPAHPNSTLWGDWALKARAQRAED